MRDADKPNFLRILNGLAAVKPGAKLTPESLDLWWITMVDWSLDEFRAAASHLARTVEFFPNPFHFDQLRRTAAEQTAGDAWAQVLAKVRTMSPRESATVAPRIDAVVRQMGGYGHLACMTQEDIPHRARRFAELWVECGEVEEAQRVLPTAARLTGPRKAAVQIARQQ
jgi:hypothetical protein